MSNRPNPSRKPSGAAQRVAAGQSRSRVDAAAASAGASRTPVIIGVIAVAVLLALLLAVRLTASDTSDTARTTGTSAGGGTFGTVVTGERNFGDVIVTGEPLPTYPDVPGAPDPAVGRQAPVVQGDTFAGDRLRIAADGTPTIVMFVAHWCPHCQKEVPVLQQHFDTVGHPAGVKLLAVSTKATAEAPNFPPSAWLEKEGWTVPTIADTQNGKAATALGIGGFPFFMALDANGTVVARTSGELEISQFLALVDQARQSTPRGATGGSTGGTPGTA